MYLSEINIEGYKIFKEKFTAKLNEGLTVIVGENGTGKSAIIDAVRVLLSEDEFGRVGIGESDFHRELTKQSKEKGVEKILINGVFSCLNDTEQVAYLPWLDYSDNTKSTLNVEIENKEDSAGKFKWHKWGNETKSGIFEVELVDAIRCIYLPPLRNAPEKLQAYRGSRLSRLIRNLTKDDEAQRQSLVDDAISFNKELLKKDAIKNIDKIIKDKISEAIGSVFGQDAMIQFSGVDFNRIIEKLKLLFYPTIMKDDEPNKDKMYRELDENSLGYNNILYLATVLAELEGLKKDDVFLKILLIEEPEAHLHPQLQSKLLQYLKSQAEVNKIQIIVITHSPTIAASVGLDAIKVVTIASYKSQPKYCNINKSGLSDNSKFFLERWLDITKSTLLFARGVLLVEGIAEALVIPELAKSIIKLNETRDFGKEKPECLEDYGVSIINMNGIYFDHFMQIFSGYSKNKDGFISKEDKIDIPCAGITDNDPKKNRRPTKANPSKGNNRILYLQQELIANSLKCRLFKNLKTFEYDLALEGANLIPMLEIISEQLTTIGKLRKEVDSFKSVDWKKADDEQKKDVAYWLLCRLEKEYPIGKGEFNQIIANKISNNHMHLVAPEYIINAVKWSIGLNNIDAK